MSARPACQIYLVAEPGLDDRRLAAALAAAPVACLLLPASAEGMAGLCQRAQAGDVAVLIADDPAAALAHGADGVHLSTAGPAVKSLRQTLGADAILGVGCGQSRHAGLLAGEAGADYVAFGTPQEPADPELLTWWQQGVTLPAVAFGADSPQGAVDLAQAGADFVALGQSLWQDGAVLADLAARLVD